jgi:hypothetical protein
LALCLGNVAWVPLNHGGLHAYAMRGHSLSQQSISPLSNWQFPLQRGTECELPAHSSKANAATAFYSY